MQKCEKVCEILIEKNDYIDEILDVLKPTGYLYCVTSDWGYDGVEITVMKKPEVKNGN